ncbi:MAG: LTA synthase family protein [Sutterellaceae bacterium]|nr:LTA synthase family protein [Sutterellaceae bacterium]
MKRILQHWDLSRVVLIALFVAVGVFLFRKNISYPIALLLGCDALGAVFFFLWTLSSRAAFSFSGASLTVLVLALLDRMKSHYYKEKLMTPDFAVALDPGNFGTLLHYPLAGAGILGSLVLSVVILFWFWKRSGLSGTKTRLAALCGAVGCAAAAFLLVSMNEANWLRTLPKGQGVVVNLLMSAREAKVPNPADEFQGNTRAFLDAAAGLPAGKALPAGARKPDVILMLQESTTDPRIYELKDGWQLPDLSVFDDRTAEKASGPLRVHTFGGGTWISEFSALTGLDPDDFRSAKNSVFYTVVGRVRNSIFREFSRNGYETIVLTSFNPSAYHSGEAYRALGVDRIVRPQDFGYPASRTENIWTIRTADMLGYARRLLDEPHEKPRFVYMLTMREHGPYDQKGSLYDVIRGHAGTDAEAVALSAYYEKLADSGEAFSEFYRYVGDRKKPTVFLRFGDHQPGIHWNRYRIPYPNPAFVTFWSLRDNLPGRSESPEIMDISFLGGLAAERAGLSLSPFYEANVAMRRLCNGKLADCPKADILYGYRSRIYSELRDFE